MLTGKELVQRWRTSAFRSQDEQDTFVAATGVPEVADLGRLVEAATARWAAEPSVERARLGVLARLLALNPDPSLFAALVRAMKTADPAARPVLASLLAQVNNPAEHGSLVELLRSADTGIRRDAARALPTLGATRQLFDALTKAAGEAGQPARTEVLDAVVTFARHQAVPALHAALKAGTPPEQVHALRHLGDARAMAKDVPGALAILGVALDPQSFSEPVVVQALLSTGALCSEDEWFASCERFLESPSLVIARAAVDSLRRFSSERVLRVLERRFHAGPRPIRLAVVNALEAMGGERVLPLLVEALGHRQQPVRTRAGEVLQTLGREGRIDAAATIVSLLRSRDAGVNRLAADLLRAVPDKEALWPALVARVRVEKYWARERIVAALVELGGLNLSPHVVALLDDPSPVLRRSAAVVLGTLRDGRALRNLVETAANDADWWVRETAIEAITRIGDARAVPYLVNIMKNAPELQPACILALQEMNARGAAAEVAKLCWNENADTRARAVQFLGAFDAREHASELRPLHDDPSLTVRNAARALLEAWSVRIEEIARPVPMLDRLLLRLTHHEGDDLIIATGKPVFMKRVGQVLPLTETPLDARQVEAVLHPHLSAEQLAALQRREDVDYPHEVKTEGLRFRANVFQQEGGLAGIFRRIKGTLPAFDSLGLPELVRNFGDLKNGLVLVGGPTGAGKSTTLAALIDHINRTSSRHIISLEDPIEVVHRRQASLVNQREVGTHTKSFAQALRATLREDPDVILVGEVRDLPTIEFTVVAAETGHLVFGTVHTVSAASSVDRIVSAFPVSEQQQVRSTLASNLRAVVCQHLLREKDGNGRVLAVEMMLNTDAVANLIRKGKTYQLPSVIATSREQGMQLMDQDLLRLLKAGRISAGDAYMKATIKKDFEPYVDAEEEGRPLSSVTAAPPTRPPTNPGGVASHSRPPTNPGAPPLSRPPSNAGASRVPTGPGTAPKTGQGKV